MVLNIEHISEISWVEVSKKVKDAIVFVDTYSSECLHWHGGLQRLKKSGAIGVKEFSSFEGGNKNEKKAVFLVANPLVGPFRMILRDIISNSSLEHCVLITPCSPAVLNLVPSGNVLDSSRGDVSALHKLESDILHWMKNEEFTVEIFHSLPYGFVPLNDYSFISPALNDIFPCFEEDLELSDTQKVSDWSMESLSLELQVGVTYLVTSLNSLLSQLNVREDIYCLGPFSNLIGSLLQKSCTSHLRPKNASTMSLLIIDRTLDLCSPVSFSSECLLDLMKYSLPKFPGHTIDVAVDMSPLFNHPGSEDQDDYSWVYPGCLHEPKGPMFDWLFYKTFPEILEGISKQVCSVLKEKYKKFSLLELEEILKTKFPLKFDIIKENSGFLQISLGITQTLKSTTIEKMKLIRSFQMLLLQILASDNNTDNALRQIKDLITSRQSKGFELEHIFYILVFFYSFIGEKYKVNSDLETLLMTALARAISEDKENYSEEGRLNFESISSADEFCGVIFKKLKSLKASRLHLFKYRDVMLYHDSMMPLEYHSLLTQLLQDILDPLKVGTPDLRHKTNESSNLTSRFTKLLSSSRTHITDSDSLLIYFVGGITAQEINTVKKFFRPYSKPVLIGSTSLLSPADVIEKLFLKNPLKPLLL